MSCMENIHWQLSVLSRAVHYKNLSAAADHVGLSQPQLSRIIAKLETELSVVLLDRAVRRKSGWTPVAYRISETYSRSTRKLNQFLQQIQTQDQVTHLSIGTLEGLVPIASTICKQLFDQPKMQMIDFHVYDLGELEEKFEKNELDLIFTCREPGKHKYSNTKIFGYQTLKNVGSNSGLKVMSQFEFASQTSRKTTGKNTRILISNSLSIRKLWIEKYSAQGLCPSEIIERKPTTEEALPVIMIGTELLSPTLWKQIETFNLKSDFYGKLTIKKTTAKNEEI